MQVTCLQCGHQFEGKFCPNCGQEATVKRLTAAVLLEEIVHFFTHLESGFPFTTWNFIIRPGITAINYVTGKRKNYQKPVSYFLVWIGLYILLHNSIINHFKYQLGNEVVSSLNVAEQSNVLFRNHLSIFLLPVIIVSALLIYYIMARPKFNFIELFVLCLYGTGTYFMMLLVSDIVLGYILHINILGMGVFLWQAILITVYNLWFSYDLFKRLGLRYFWARLILTSILIALSGWLMMFYIPMVFVYFLELNK